LTGLCAQWGPKHLRATFGVAFNSTSLLLFLAAPVLVARALPDDLNEMRRRSRLSFLAFGSLLGAGLSVAFVAASGPGALTFGSLSVLALCLWMIATRTVDMVKPRAALSKALDAQEVRHLAQLRALAQDQGVISDPGLSLSRLSQILKLPEHKVRRLVHLGDGAENFSVWLNTIRIERVAGQLADPTCDQEPISTLAYSAGYNALSVFNRAFRARYGVSPSVFRANRGQIRTAAAIDTAIPTAEIDKGMTGP
jgi:AraC-like DNA-binding protein